MSCFALEQPANFIASINFSALSALFRLGYFRRIAADKIGKLAGREVCFTFREIVRNPGSPRNLMPAQNGLEQ
jgi:hypothetical protein